jgi:hypothetical protein
MNFVSLYNDNMRIPIFFKHMNLFKGKEKMNLNHRGRWIPFSLWSNRGQDHTKPANHCLWHDIGNFNPRGIANSGSTRGSYEWIFFLLSGVMVFNEGRV